MSIRLQNGSRICIIGGGPAGSFAALHLLKLAEEHGLQLEVLIFESRDASRPGRESCKGCAGILSASLVSSLAAFGITLPPQIIQAELRAYVVHVYGQVTSIEQPDPRRRILSVYRGTGPRQHEGAPLVGLDGFLLLQACEHGAQLIPHRVREVEWTTARCCTRRSHVISPTWWSWRAASTASRHSTRLLATSRPLR